MQADNIKQKAVSFTGHRPETMGEVFDERLIAQLLSHAITLAIEDGYTTFYTGMARGVDIIAGECVVALQKSYPHITLSCVIPFQRQPYYWDDSWIARYQHLLFMAKQQVLISKSYCKQAYAWRNQYLVDHSGLLIAVVRKNTFTGGSIQTMRYAKQQEVKVISIELA